MFSMFVPEFALFISSLMTSTWDVYFCFEAVTYPVEVVHTYNSNTLGIGGRKMRSSGTSSAI